MNCIVFMLYVTKNNAQNDYECEEKMWKEVTVALRKITEDLVHFPVSGMGFEPWPGQYEAEVFTNM